MDNQPDIHTLNRLLAESDPIDTTVLEPEKETIMKLTELFPSTLLKAQDVTDAGGEMPVTIKEVSVRDFDGENGKESKPVMTFADGKQIVLNKTNANTLGDMLGGDTDAWLGKEITLIVEQVDFSGKKVPAIRIKNLDSNEAAIQAFWKKTREIGLTREEGLSQLKDAGQDFRKALKMLESPF